MNPVSLEQQIDLTVAKPTTLEHHDDLVLARKNLLLNLSSASPSEVQEVLAYLRTAAATQRFDANDLHFLNTSIEYAHSYNIPLAPIYQRGQILADTSVGMSKAWVDKAPELIKHYDIQTANEIADILLREFGHHECIDCPTINELYTYSDTIISTTNMHTFERIAYNTMTHTRGADHDKESWLAAAATPFSGEWYSECGEHGYNTILQTLDVLLDTADRVAAKLASEHQFMIHFYHNTRRPDLQDNGVIDRLVTGIPREHENPKQDLRRQRQVWRTLRPFTYTDAELAEDE